MTDTTPSGRRFHDHPVDGDLLTLHEPNSTEFDVILHRVRRAEGDPIDVRIVFEMGWPTFDRTIAIFSFFHVTEDVPAGVLIEGKRVQVEARLDDVLAREHFASAGPDAIAARLLDLSEHDRGHALLETEAWFGLTVSQASAIPAEDTPEGALREGFATAWASAERVSR